MIINKLASAIWSVQLSVGLEDKIVDVSDYWKAEEKEGQATLFKLVSLTSDSAARF
jgi:hypothetical protein